MSRPLRIEVPGGFYHVTSRGNRREHIFFCDTDRIYWLTLFGEVCKRFGWRCHAYCQMSNHWHVLIETPSGNISNGMRQLNGSYTQYINRVHHRVGHVYQGRYKAILIEKETYLLELLRYIVLNPVRAKMVPKAADWHWSSYLGTTGAVPAPIWLETNSLLRQFGTHLDQARHLYAAFVDQGIGSASPWEGLRAQIYLGSDTFVSLSQALLSADQPLEEIPRIQKETPEHPLSHYPLRFTSQREAMAQACLSGHCRMKQIALFFGVHYSTVSRALRRHLRLQASQPPDLP